MKEIKNIWNVLMLAVICGLLLWGMREIWDFNLQDKISPPFGVTLDAWYPGFMWWLKILALITLLLELIWYFINWLQKPTRVGNSGRSSLWYSLLILVLAALVIARLIGPQVMDGSIWVILSIATVTIFQYWFATLLFSPDNVKYTPLFAKYIRKW